MGEQTAMFFYFPRNQPKLIPSCHSWLHRERLLRKMFSACTKAALNFHLLVIEGRLGSVVACGDMGNVRGFCELPFLKQAS